MKTKNDFIKAIGGNAKGYRAYFKLPSGKIGITTYFTKQTLEAMVIPEAESQGNKLLRIEKE